MSLMDSIANDYGGIDLAPSGDWAASPAPKLPSGWSLPVILLMMAGFAAIFYMVKK